MNYQSHKKSPWLQLTNKPIKVRFLTYWKLEAWEKMLDLHYINNFWFIKCSHETCVFCRREEKVVKWIITAVFVYETQEVKLFRLSYKLYNKLYEALSKEKEKNDKYVLDMRENKWKTKMRFLRLKEWIEWADFIISKESGFWKTNYNIKVFTEKNKWKTDLDEISYEKLKEIWKLLIENKMNKLDKDQEIILRKNWLLKNWSITEQILEKIKEENKNNKKYIFSWSDTMSDNLFA